MLRLRYLVLCLLLVTITGVVSADRLELRNGDTITGRIVSMDDETIMIETEYGTLAVSRSSVVSGSFGGVDALETEPGDPLFYFPLDGSVDDATGSYVAVNNGMRFVADPNGLPRSALRSDGTGTYLSIAATDELDQLSSLSILFDVRLEDTSTTQYLISKWSRAEVDSADGKFTVRNSGGTIRFYIVAADGSYHWVDARNVLTENEWHSVALTFAGGRCAIYVDGAVVASDRFSFTDLFVDTEPILVMTAEAQNDRPFAYHNALGTIDEIRLYDYALSPDEIASLATVVAVTE